MTDVILKGVCAMLLLAVVFLAGVCWINIRDNDALTARNERLSGALQAIDLKAKEDEIKFKENADVIKDKDSKYRAAIRYYERMLSEAANSPSTGKTSEDTTGMDEAPRWPTLSGCPPEVEREFFENTRVRAGMAEHFRLNQYPIE